MTLKTRATKPGAGLFPMLKSCLIAAGLALCGAGSVAAGDTADEHQQVIPLSGQQVEAGRFAVIEAGGRSLERSITAPGSIVPSGDHIARVAVRLVGTIAALRKRLGDRVEAGEVVAVIESREVADAKSDYLAARLVFELQQTLFARSKMLFEGKVLSENDYLRARITFEDARIKIESARQKLFALNLTAEQIEALPSQPVATLRQQELHAPITGRIAERRVELGSLVGREGQESEIYVIVDSSVVWVELAVAPSDLAHVREGQTIALAAAGDGETSSGVIMFVSPLLDKDTRTARVVASIANPDGRWRPNAFVTAKIPVTTPKLRVAVPKTSIQTLKGVATVFVQNAAGFAARKVTTGRSDAHFVEVTSGLEPGERIASGNTFVLKAELVNSHAAHDN